MANEISERFILAVNKLIKDNKVKSKRSFSLSLEYLPQSLSEVYKGKRDVPIEVLQKAVEQYKFNPIFLLMGQGDMFLSDDAQNTFKTLTVVTDKDNEERIIHVPMPAQAGYAQAFNEIEMIRDLPSYSLPFIAYQTGTFRSFDVKGESMEPTIEEGQKLICSYLEPSLWETGIKDHHVYVIVTREDVVVKRVINNLRKHKHLEAHSDNESFSMYRIQGNDIQEVWYVRDILSDFKHHATGYKNPNHEENVDRLLEIIKAQADLIEQYREIIKK